jgi:hypothetical protein
MLVEVYLKKKKKEACNLPPAVDHREESVRAGKDEGQEELIF